MFNRSNIIIGLVVIGFFIYPLWKRRKNSNTPVNTQKKESKVETFKKKVSQTAKKVKEKLPLETTKAANTETVVEEIIEEPETITVKPAPAITAEEQARIVAEEEKKTEAAIIEVKQAKFDRLTVDEQIEDVNDYSQLLKPILLEKYDERKFLDMLEQAELYLKDRAAYESIYREIRTKEVRTFLYDIEEAKITRRKRAAP
jgi:type IV secretory pathway VirJ component